MLIKYRFSINGHAVNPIYKDDLSKDYALEPQQRFYRSELTGALKFLKADFDWIMDQSFETEYIVLVEKSNDGGLTWNAYYTGSFFRSDCQIDLDSKKIEVKLSTKDQYNEVLAGLEKEYDLLKLAPAKTPLSIDKRPLIQLYIPGDSVVSCFLGGNSWEQEVHEPIGSLVVPNTWAGMIEYMNTQKTLLGTYYFALASNLHKCLVTNYSNLQDLTSGVRSEYVGETKTSSTTFSGLKMYSREGSYYILYTQSDKIIKLELIRSSDSLVLFTSGNLGPLPISRKITMNAITASGATGYIVIYWTYIPVYMRYLLDVNTVSGLNTYAIPANDIVENNRNYKRAIGYATDCATISNRVSDIPTKYGISDDGMYWQMPYNSWGAKFYPIARSTWGLSSIWFAFEVFDWVLEEQGRKSYMMKDSMMISEAIRVLLNIIDPTITHDGTSDYSQFLYGTTNPITYRAFRVMITQKSNILAGEYDQPAQKAPVTLSAILAMLRDTMKVYWYIEDNKFKLEHISWFKNGGAYSGTPVTSFDLTTLIQQKNKKPWGFVSSKYSYDKVDMAERYEFGWMDDVTEGFAGYPIEINSKYVQRGKIENVNISAFTSDIDYMLLSPGSISQDGFALFGAIWNGTENRYELPYIERTVDGAELRLQNGLMSFIYLHPNFWTHDLPAMDVTINEDPYTLVQGIERKKKQKISFPSLEDPNPLQLIKTYLGDGQIEKLSVNLHSRMNDIELKYDTE